ncbi:MULTISPECIES: PH domain-containing protein [unclassified Corynebacterium]|uniref:PH domain-containing protein n=1 Tax=unclassified Corynebacterium TaxID=2624378 RepID=UPI002A9117C9|nr:PH domain-containing protein [Corynebacterium sp.]MDY5785252.1 PH domain-containing protein [Corynebacterium sp.]
MKLSEGEVVLADTCGPLTGLIFPLLELIVVTGLCWMAIGWMDVNGIDAIFRNAVVGLWALLALLRFVMPVARSRRRRFTVTNRRVIARGGAGRADSIPLQQIHSARTARGGVSLAVYGFERPLHYADVGKAKKVQRVLNAQLARY